MSNQVKLIIISFGLFLLGGSFIFLGVGGLKSSVFPKASFVPITATATPASDLQAPQIIVPEVVEESSDSAILGKSYSVTKVVDGDTIEVSVDGEVKKVRLIGINTPETVDPRRKVQCFGKEASNETKGLLGGRSVYMVKDVSETDKYGRLLRYVYLKTEGNNILFVNDYLVREGFAQVSTYPPDIKYQSRFIEAENEARSNNKGLWGKCPL